MVASRTAKGIAPVSFYCSMAKQEHPLTGEALIKEVCRRIRVARSYWDAHNNAACRGERDRALALYNTLTKEQKDQIPQQLRVWRELSQ